AGARHLHHVDAGVGRPPRAAAPPRSRLDGDGLRWTDRLAQLAGDAAFLSVRIAPQRKLAAKAGGERPLLKRIVQRCLRLEEVAQHQEECGYELSQKNRPGRLIKPPCSNSAGLGQFGHTLEHLALAGSAAYLTSLSLP